MTLQRRLMLLFAFLAAGGSLALTTFYAARLRSETYRRQVESDLTRFFSLPCEVGSVRGSTFSSREFRDVAIHLPSRRDQVFQCRRALWFEDRVGGRIENRLEVNNGSLTLGSDRWQREDYRTIFKSGLGHDFTEMGLRRINVTDFAIGFRRGELALECRKAGGQMDFTQGDEGLARLVAYELNGYPIKEGVSINARFKLPNGLDVTDVSLEVPQVPLAAIGLERALHGKVTRGEFAGTIRYSNPDTKNPPDIWISGKLLDGRLAELTRKIPFGPLEGDISVNVSEARLSKSVFTHLFGSGSISGLSFQNFAPALGIPSLSGSISLTIDPVNLELGHIRRLRVEGRSTGVRLEEVLQLWGHGSATGRVNLEIRNLDIVADAIQSADLDLEVVPEAGHPGTIDRELLLSVVERLFGFSWPSAIPQELLPSQVEYAKFGVRLVVRNNQLRILGTHGADHDVILTIKLFGNEIPVLRERKTTIDLTPWVAQVLARLQSYDPEHVKEWLRKHPQGAPG